LPCCEEEFLGPDVLGADDLPPADLDIEFPEFRLDESLLQEVHGLVLDDIRDEVVQMPDSLVDRVVDVAFVRLPLMENLHLAGRVLTLLLVRDRRVLVKVVVGHVPVSEGLILDEPIVHRPAQRLDGLPVVLSFPLMKLSLNEVVGEIILTGLLSGLALDQERGSRVSVGGVFFSDLLMSEVFAEPFPGDWELELFLAYPIELVFVYFNSEFLLRRRVVLGKKELLVIGNYFDVEVVAIYLEDLLEPFLDLLLHFQVILILFQVFLGQIIVQLLNFFLGLLGLIEIIPTSDFFLLGIDQVPNLKFLTALGGHLMDRFLPPTMLFLIQSGAVFLLWGGKH